MFLRFDKDYKNILYLLSKYRLIDVNLIHKTSYEIYINSHAWQYIPEKLIGQEQDICPVYESKLQVPPFWQGLYGQLISYSFKNRVKGLLYIIFIQLSLKELLWSQYEPMNPGRHLHVIKPLFSCQVAPFLHGFGIHSVDELVIDIWHLGPV